MTSFINNNSNVLARASYAAGMACGAVVGYASEDLVGKALIATGCGVARAASHIIFTNPLTKQFISAGNKLISRNSTDQVANLTQKVVEKDIIYKKMNISRIIDGANLGFSHGMALGTVGAAETFAEALSGGLIYAAGFYAEVLPIVALGQGSLVMNFDVSGNPI